MNPLTFIKILTIAPNSAVNQSFTVKCSIKKVKHLPPDSISTVISGRVSSLTQQVGNQTISQSPSKPHHQVSDGAG